MDYKCYHCGQEFVRFSETVAHNVEEHPYTQLKIRIVTINPKTGNKSYGGHGYNVIPAHLLNVGKRIIGTDSHKIVILSENESAVSSLLDEHELGSVSGRSAQERLHELLPDVINRLDTVTAEKNM
jgi:hypothetical protein